MRMAKKIISKVLRWIVVAAAQLPLKFHYFMWDAFSWLLKNVAGYRTGMVWMNISRAFPDMKYRDLKVVYGDFYRHLGEIFAEALWFGGSSYERLDRQGIVTVKNPQVLEELYDASPSVTVLCSHCGNWELLGGVVGYMRAGDRDCPFSEKDVTVVYKRLTNAVADEVFAANRMAPLPVKYEECMVESMKVLRFSISRRDEKRIYIYPADQAPGRGMSHCDMGMFLNQQTYAMTGSVGVACKLSHAVVYMKMVRLERGKYQWEFIPICKDASVISPEELMKEYYRLLEEEIRQTPCNWLWSHNRWKMYKL